MKNENKINWLPIMESKREEIELAIKQAKRDAEHTMQGWYVDVEIDENDVWAGGLKSQGSQSMSSWEGKSYVITSIKTWQVEIEESQIIENHKELYEEFEAQREDGFECAYEFMQEKYPEIREEWINEAREYEIDEFNAYDILEEAIEQYKLQLEADEYNNIE